MSGSIVEAGKEEEVGTGAGENPGAGGTGESGATGGPGDEGAPSGSETPDPEGGEQGTGETGEEDPEVARLREELEAERAARADLAAKLSAAKTPEEFAEAQRRAEDLALELLRRDVAHSAGIPPAFASRLQGATKEELAADAAEVKRHLVPVGGGSGPLRGGLSGAPTEEEKFDAAKVAAEQRRRRY